MRTMFWVLVSGVLCSPIGCSSGSSGNSRQALAQSSNDHGGSGKNEYDGCLCPARHYRMTFSKRFFPSDCEFLTQGSSSYVVLEPGYQLVLEGEDDDTELLLVITVLDELETVAGVDTRVVEEREWEDGELIEISRNFFALCRQTGDLYYFGEDVDVFEDGEVTHPGQWRAGEKGAFPGVLIPGSPIIGARFYQEVAPGVALDRAEVVDILEAKEVEGGTFESVLFLYETTALEPDDESFKFFSPGVGLIKDDEAELVDYGFNVFDIDDGGDEDGEGGED